MDQNATLNDLLNILSEKPVNLHRLREFGRVYGFVNVYGRNLAITCLAESMGDGKKTGSNFEQLKKKATEIVSASKFQHQIHIDVERAMNSIDFFVDLQEDQLKYHRGNLEQLLQLFIANNSEYSYYQGFHDITTVLLYTFGLNDAFNILYKLAENYYMDALKYPFEKSVNLQLQFVLKILGHFDPAYAEEISIAYNGVPVFAVSWILTWFSHSFKKVDVIQRIFDFLISSPPSSILYMSAALILISKEKLLATATDDLDIAVIHSFFQKLDLDDPDFLISTTIEMEKQLKFQKVLENSDLTFPEESIFRLEKKAKPSGKYYQHQLQGESKALLLSVSGKQNKIIQETIMKSVGTIGFVLFLSLVSYKVFSRKKI